MDQPDLFPFVPVDPRTVPPTRFDGSDYVPERDNARLTGQLLRIFNTMADRQWRTLGEIEAETGDPQASISAQLRHLRKPRFGAYRVEKQHRGDPEDGLYEYRVLEGA